MIDGGKPMKKYLFAFILILAACSAQPIQATVTRFATMTATLPPPTATILPTPTLNPQFLAIQTQVAASENYTVMGNGNVEGKLPDGTIGVIPGIKLNPDGTSYTITVNGAPVVIEADKVSITDDGISIEGYSHGSANGEFDEIVKSDAQLWAEQSGGGYDEVNGVAWDKSTGLVMWAKDAKGEWINYPDGNVSLPPGPGYENEPPLMVTYYHSFNEAMEAITDKLGWEELRETYRAAQDAENNRIADVYWIPLASSLNYTPSFYERLNLHDSIDPNLEAEAFVSEIMTPQGLLGLRIRYQSASIDHYKQDAFIFDANPAATFAELRRIDACVVANALKSNLRESCASEIIEIYAPKIK